MEAASTCRPPPASLFSSGGATKNRTESKKRGVQPKGWETKLYQNKVLKHIMLGEMFLFEVNIELWEESVAFAPRENTIFCPVESILF